MEEIDIPIDISVNKLLQWLVSRHHVPKDWEQKLSRVREKIKDASTDMPDAYNLKSLVSSPYLNYYYCLQIVDCLKKTEADTKTIFGGYNSKRMKDWQEIVTLYQKNNIYLADVAHSIIQNVTYEIPNLKKQVTKLEQISNDVQKKIKDISKVEATALREFNQLCQQLEITGHDIKHELLNLVKLLPQWYNSTADKLKLLEPTLHFYEQFVHFSFCNNEFKLSSLNALNYIVKNGNVNASKYIQCYSNEEKLNVNITHQTEDPNTIKIINTNKSSDAVIDYDIDWGDVDTDQPVDNEIDFDLSENVEICVVEEGENEYLNNDSTILDNIQCRMQIMHALLEIDTFLKIRLLELSTEGDMFILNQFQDLPSHSIDDLNEMRTLVKSVIADMTDKKNTHLYNIKHSPKYIDLLTESLNHKLRTVEQMKKKKADFEEEVVKTASNIRLIKPTIDILVGITKYLQGKIESDISLKYKGRSVNIVGAINAL